MNEQSTYQDSFVTWLEELRDKEDRGTLAAMRRWLSQPEGTLGEASRVVQKRLAMNASNAQESAYHLVGALFALHPEAGGEGNMGDHFRKLCENPNEPPANVERRFMALLASDANQLDDTLRQAIALLKANSVPVDWHQLMRHVLTLKGHNDEARLRVQRWWARRFWRSESASTTVKSQASASETQSV